MPKIKITGGSGKLPREEILSFKKFRCEFYRGDEFYVATEEFVIDMLLNKTSAFAKSLDVRTISATEEGKRIAQCLYIVAPNTDFAQICHFDCPTERKDLATALIRTAMSTAKECDLKRIVAGLCGHLSYGVGILTETNLKNSFDTNYNKMHTAEFFKDFKITNTLSAYRCQLKDAHRRLSAMNCDVEDLFVREADFSKFKDECETLRRLCDATIGDTYLYSKTAEGHFYELLKELKLLLSGKNLLFLMHGNKEVGFVFWHPDFNCTVRAGRPLTKAAFALGCIFNSRKIDTVKLNAIGVLKDYRGKGTIALLRALDEHTKKYKFIETNFVWDNNIESTLINRRLLGEKCRKFSVYEEYL